jgi:hypothetical protein
MARPGAPVVEEPLRLEERQDVAETCAAKLALEPMPVLVDDMEDGAERAYEAWPDLLVLVDREGRVAYRSGAGPFGFKPDELEAAIRTLRRDPVVESGSPAGTEAGGTDSPTQVSSARTGG